MSDPIRAVVEAITAKDLSAQHPDYGWTKRMRDSEDQMWVAALAKWGNKVPLTPTPEAATAPKEIGESVESMGKGFWVHPEKGEVVHVPPGGFHAQVVSDNHEKFGISKLMHGSLNRLNPHKGDPDHLEMTYAAVRRGWVRVRHYPTGAGNAGRSATTVSHDGDLGRASKALDILRDHGHPTEGEVEIDSVHPVTRALGIRKLFYSHASVTKAAEKPEDAARAGLRAGLEPAGATGPDHVGFSMEARLFPDPPGRRPEGTPYGWWVHPEKGHVVPVGNQQHAVTVGDHPEKFGIHPKEAQSYKSMNDAYHGAMSKGWVRIGHAFRGPGRNYMTYGGMDSVAKAHQHLVDAGFDHEPGEARVALFKHVADAPDEHTFQTHSDMKSAAHGGDASVRKSLRPDLEGGSTGGNDHIGFSMEGVVPGSPAGRGVTQVVTPTMIRDMMRKIKFMQVRPTADQSSELVAGGPPASQMKGGSAGTAGMMESAKAKVHLKDKELIGKFDGMPVYLVSDPEVRTHIVDYAGGGNPMRYDRMPEEIWVGRTEDKFDQAMVVAHEIVEYLRMKFGAESYATAHKHANEVELILRHVAGQEEALIEDAAEAFAILLTEDGDGNGVLCKKCGSPHDKTSECPDQKGSEATPSGDGMATTQHDGSRVQEAHLVPALPSGIPCRGCGGTAWLQRGQGYHLCKKCDSTFLHGPMIWTGPKFVKPDPKPAQNASKNSSPEPVVQEAVEPEPWKGHDAALQHSLKRAKSKAADADRAPEIRNDISMAKAIGHLRLLAKLGHAPSQKRLAQMHADATSKYQSDMHAVAPAAGFKLREDGDMVEPEAVVLYPVGTRTHPARTGTALPFHGSDAVGHFQRSDLGKAHRIEHLGIVDHDGKPHEAIACDTRGAAASVRMVLRKMVHPDDAAGVKSLDLSSGEVWEAVGDDHPYKPVVYDALSRYGRMRRDPAYKPGDEERSFEEITKYHADKAAQDHFFKVMHPKMVNRDGEYLSGTGVNTDADVDRIINGIAKPVHQEMKRLLAMREDTNQYTGDSQGPGDPTLRTMMSPTAVSTDGDGGSAPNLVKRIRDRMAALKGDTNMGTKFKGANTAADNLPPDTRRDDPSPANQMPHDLR